ncbi:MAG TPA: VCBS repeat-containing protein [Verrucomicrobiae bacterium]|nr:VCBS repeat-containing protein [Verrucomicrobiae bacterium]
MRSHTAGLVFNFVLLVAAVLFTTAGAAEPEQPWKRHAIDDSSRGADGVRLADVNQDGRLDIVTGWEEGGVVRVYQNPGPTRAREKWPSVTVGTTANVEDAVLVDIDGDGSLDVVSCAEGNTRRMFVHWAPSDRAKYLDASAWTTGIIPASVDRMMWMFSLPVQIDDKDGVDLFAGGKERGGQIGWWQAPKTPRRLEDWQWHNLRDAGWVMSLVSSDMDGDGDLDLVFSDRKGPRSGCFWLENPGTNARLTEPWREHPIGGQGHEVMFLALADLDRDGLEDVIVATKPKQLLFLRRLGRDGQQWERHEISLPENTGNAKAVNVGDINLDGAPDLVFTCEGSSDGKSGVMWLSNHGSTAKRDWQPHKISGPDGIKHDLVQLLDLDDDGDPDVLTCEETRNLGVFWYENPANR